MKKSLHPPISSHTPAARAAAATLLGIVLLTSPSVGLARVDFGVNSLEHRLDYPFAPGVVTDNTDIGSQTSNPVVSDSFPQSLMVSNTGLTGFLEAPATNRHFFFFATDDGQGAGPVARPFLEQEAWEMSVDVTIATTRPDIRKSAGFGFEYFFSPPDQNRRNPQFVAHSNQDGQQQLADPPGKIAAFSGVFGNAPFGLTYDSAPSLAASDTVSLSIVYTPPERDMGGAVLTPANFEFTADIMGDGLEPEVHNSFQSEGFVQGIPDGTLLGVRVQPWGNIDGGTANGGQGDDYSVLFENFSLIDPTATPLLVGDYNNDGQVNAVDYTVWRDVDGQSLTLPNESPDATTPGLVDAEDYLAWATNYGSSLDEFSTSSTIPEPGALLLLAAVGPALLWSRAPRLSR